MDSELIAKCSSGHIFRISERENRDLYRLAAVVRTVPCRYVLSNCDEVGCSGGHETGAHMGRWCGADALAFERSDIERCAGVGFLH